MLKSLVTRRCGSKEIGKAGVTASLERQVARMFHTRELIKIKALDTCGEDAGEAAAMLAEKTEAQVVDVVGRTALLYRRNLEVPDGKRVSLPEE